MEFSAGSVLVLVLLGLCSAEALQWPQPYRRYASRPKALPFCKAAFPFCPTGDSTGKIPVMADTDQIEVLALKAPVWEFKYGDLLGTLKIFHDAVGFRNLQTGQNFTTEWYELFQLFNCSFPHEVAGAREPVWCNQGAACLYVGITDNHWKANGTITLVSTITGHQFNQLADWIHQDNNTGIYYETFQVDDSDGPSAKVWFWSYDCASYVLRLFDAMHTFGAVFNKDVKLNYTRMRLYSNEPQLLGNSTEIFGAGSNKTDTASDLMKFYSNFTPMAKTLTFAEHLLKIFEYVVLEEVFYLYYNNQYWLLPMKSPFAKITYTEIPLPGVTPN
ncbi:bis(monoacylglycero)phosphate synthase CLN5-like [Sycon ciliatum]|uniref:bis(monoacylglycero)phosphate synthase CLN5-like n=1 Tax=Sycon ciliatum TaxID=27933 RepID=UPI0031F6B3F1